MKAKLIESLDRQRYWAVILVTVALLDIFVETTLFYSVHWMSAANVFAVNGYIGIPLLIAAGIWYCVIECRVARDKELRQSLRNEMYIANQHLSRRIALWVVMCALAVSFVFEDVSLLRAQIVCEIIFFLGLSTLSVSWLVYNRKRKEVETVRRPKKGGQNDGTK